jgi:hypothetical protein
MITSHLQIENHQKMYFTHGFASRGVLVIQGDVTPNQLRTLQAQWTNQTAGPTSAWRTPILAGIQGVQWQPLVVNARDMEYAVYQDHVLRTIHACFTIDPEETGFGYLSKPTGQRSAMSESSNQWKITMSRDKGLRPILRRIESIVNEEILKSWRPDLADKYEFMFIGLDAETQEEEIQRQQAEVQLHTTINEVREQAEKEPLEIGGGLILNPLLLQTLQANMTKGMFMEKYMNIKGAADRPDLQYIPDPLWFQWQQFQMSLMQQQAAASVPQPGAPGGGSNGSKKDSKGGKGGDSGSKKDGNDKEDQKAAQAEQEQMMMQQQAQMQAIDQYIQANPELFKSMNDNLKKAEVNMDYLDKMRDGLLKDFDRASGMMIKEIMQAVNEDLQEREDPDAVEKSDPVQTKEDADDLDFMVEKIPSILKEDEKQDKKKKKKKKDGATEKDPDTN